MPKQIWVICVICFLFGAVTPRASCQSDLEAAKALLANLTVERRNLAEEHDPEKAAEQREHLALELGSLPDRVEKLVKQGMVDDLSNGSLRSAAELQSALRGALAGAAGNEGGAVAYAFNLDAPPRASYLVIFVIEYCAVCSRSWVGVIAPDGEGRFKIATQIEDPLPNQSVNVALLGATKGQPAFLAYGTHWGDAHRRMNAAVYVTDGEKVTSIWSVADVPEGDITLVGNSFFILKSYTGLKPPFVLRTQVYALRADGIKLQSASERPAS